MITASRTTQSAAVDGETEQLPAAAVRSGRHYCPEPASSPGCAYRTARLARCLFPHGIPADFATRGDDGRRLAITTDVPGMEVSSMGSAGRFPVDRWRAEDPVAWHGDEAISCPFRSPKHRRMTWVDNCRGDAVASLPAAVSRGLFTRGSGVVRHAERRRVGSLHTRQKRRIPAQGLVGRALVTGGAAPQEGPGRQPRPHSQRRPLRPWARKRSRSACTAM